MNAELLTYIESLGNDIARRLWLTAMSTAARNGTSNIIWRDMELKYRTPAAELIEILGLQEAQNLKLVKVLARGDSFVAINFKNKETVVKAPGVKKSKSDKPAQRPCSIVPCSIVPSSEDPEQRNNGTTEQFNEPAPLYAIKGEAMELVVYAKPPVDENGLMIGTAPNPYKITTPLRRCLIFDYCEFYKALIVYRASLMGNMVNKPVNPKITAYDGKAFGELAGYFRHVGFNTEQAIRLAFQRIYNSWEKMPDRVQNYFSPAQICRNWNIIYEQMIQLKNGKQSNHTNRKDKELAEKLAEAGERDYSYMVQA